MRVSWWLMVVVTPVALAVAGCGSSPPRSAGPSWRAIEAAFHGFRLRDIRTYLGGR